MDKSWIHLQNKCDVRYMDGISNFVNFAVEHNQGKKRYRCPCTKCLNSQYASVDVMTQHLFKYGMMWSYTTWNLHGEEEGNRSASHFGSDYSYQGASTSSTGAASWNPEMDAVHDAFPAFSHVTHPHEEAGGYDNPNYNNTIPPTLFPDMDTANMDKYNNMLLQAQTSVYDGCKLSILRAIMTEMKYKVKHKISDAGFNDIQQHICDLLPDGHNLPDSHYKVKKVLKSLGLHYKKIDACRNDCVLFYKEYVNEDYCPVCKESRWQNTSNYQGSKKKAIRGSNRVAVKVLRYFPLIPRLQRLYMSTMTARAMRWHAERQRVDDDVLRHPADGEAFKHFDREFEDFAAEIRNVRLGLSTDGFNPWGNNSAAVSTWPVILMPYNLPPWMCMNKEYNFLTLLIPGPKSPGKCLDVYLRPLIDELKVLWSNGVATYDKFSNTMFTMRAAVMWTISDFPAYGMLASCTTKGYKACPVCLDEVNSSYHAGKVVYLGHRRWLPHDHHWRYDKEDFDGLTEEDPKPSQWSGSEIFQRLIDFNFGLLSNDENVSKHNPNPPDGLKYWHHMSIFFELPYWSRLKLRNNLDVMHIEKNVCDSVVGTILGITSKTKDTPKARRDLEEMGLRRSLWLTKDRKGNYSKMPDATFTVKRDHRDTVFSWFKSVRYPSKYAANISRCVHVGDHKFFGLKTHDCHVMFQRLIPVVIRPYLHKDVHEPIVALCRWWQRLCAREVKKTDVVELQQEIVLILCKLERIFPPAFFDIMIHLMIHLPEQVLLTGPVHYTWMYPQERQLGQYKGFVKNKSAPYGSIAETYLMHECVTYCDMYLQDPVETPASNAHGSINLSVVTDLIQPFRATLEGESLSRQDHDEAHWVVLRDCDEVQGFITQYRDQVRSTHVDKSDEWVEMRFKKRFPKVFQEWMVRLQQSNSTFWTYEKHTLASKPISYRIYPGCWVNGVKFHSIHRDQGKTTQNSGIAVGKDNEIYYGVLLYVVQLLYGNDIEVYLFKCKWFKRLKQHLGLLSVDTNSSGWEDEPFTLATSARQVFYLDDPKLGGGWKIVCNMSQRGIWSAATLEGSIVDAYQEPSTSVIPSAAELIRPNEYLPHVDGDRELTNAEIEASNPYIDEDEVVDEDFIVYDEDDDGEYDSEEVARDEAEEEDVEDESEYNDDSD